MKTKKAQEDAFATLVIVFFVLLTIGLYFLFFGINSKSCLEPIAEKVCMERGTMLTTVYAINNGFVCTNFSAIDPRDIKTYEGNQVELSFLKEERQKCKIGGIFK